MKQTEARMVQQELVKILGEHEADLRIDDRAVTVTGVLPSGNFTNRKWPIVCVDRPSVVSDEDWSGVERRKVLTVPVLMLEVTGAASQERYREGEERLALIAEAVRALLMSGEVDPHWNLVGLSLFRSMVTFSPAQVMEVEGANVLMLVLEVTVPLIVPTGVLPEVEEEEEEDPPVDPEDPEDPVEEDG